MTLPRAEQVNKRLALMDPAWQRRLRQDEKGWRMEHLLNAIDAWFLMDMKRRRAEQRRSCKRKHDEVFVDNDGARLN